MPVVFFWSPENGHLTPTTVAASKRFAAIHSAQRIDVFGIPSEQAVGNGVTIRAISLTASRREPPFDLRYEFTSRFTRPAYGALLAIERETTRSDIAAAIACGTDTRDRFTVSVSPPLLTFAGLAGGGLLVWPTSGPYVVGLDSHLRQHVAPSDRLIIVDANTFDECIDALGREPDEGRSRCEAAMETVEDRFRASRTVPGR